LLSLKPVSKAMSMMILDELAADFDLSGFAAGLEGEVGL